MYVRTRMTENPITITRQTTIAEALDLMRRSSVRRLPVMENGKLIGIVTDRDLSEVSPSPATSLSVFEINYLLAKMKIGDVLPKNQTVITIHPDAFLEEAALLMREHKIGALPVMEDGKLVGIITETNIFDAFIDLLGVRDAGTRITIEVEDKPGVLADVTEVIRDYGANILRVAVFRNGGDKTLVVIRLNTADVAPIVEVLKQHGYSIHSVVNYQEFQPN
ncbi:CBS and ACT domain-containing protein [Zhaonella formicivorans]|uniref:CBS and ACT domain-containing protein n=1 Tax=Zhaonella formicivorans TaxID=2528593 RepID=UPI0010D264FE|nr:CBS and ACT domain-containing protein [Zhaonella formicivorans]